MPDEAVVPEIKEAPETGAPPEAQPESPDTTDWKSKAEQAEKRYEDLRPEADRRASVLADLEGRNGPDRQSTALAEVARIELAEEEEEEPEEDFDLPDPLEQIQAIKDELAQRDEAAQAAEFDQLEQNYIEKTVEDLEKAESLDLTDEEYQIVVNYGLQNRDAHDERPDLEGGLKALKASWKAAEKRLAKSATDSVLAPAGTTGEQKVDLRDKDARQKLGEEVFLAHQRANS